MFFQKNLLIIFICCSAMLCLGQEDIDKKEQELLAQEKKIAKEMFEARVKLLEKDPHLKKIHDKIMELHKELALMLDRKKEMRVLIDKMKKVKKSLDAIRDQKKENEPDDDEEEEEEKKSEFKMTFLNSDEAKPQRLTKVSSEASILT